MLQELTECELILLSNINQVHLHTADQDIATELQETYQPANLQGIRKFLQFCLSDQGKVESEDQIIVVEQTRAAGVTSVPDN